MPPSPHPDAAFRKLKSETASLGVRVALLNLGGVLDAKAYNPNQPRVPRGQREGGEWLPAFFSRFSKEALAFGYAHRKEITRALGALQVVGGTVEALGGGGLVVGGVATSETGVGLGGVAVGAWMAVHGYDNVEAGLRALVTGEPQQTATYKTLREIGLSDAQASAVEIGLAGGSAATAGMSLAQIDRAATAKLASLSVEPFAPDALTVEINGQSLWKTEGIGPRGAAWEAADAAETGFIRTPPTFPVFDQVSEDGAVAVSNKTLDLAKPTYPAADRKAVYNRLRQYTDDVADYDGDGWPSFELRSDTLEERRLNVLMPAGESLPAQAAQIRSAQEYAASRAVTLTIRYAH